MKAVQETWRAETAVLPSSEPVAVKWPELYERFLPGWRDLNPVTRSDVEDPFRRKVNKYRQTHRRRREPE